MSALTTPAASAPQIPVGFFDEVAALLDADTAEEIADAVITVCIHRGILHPELDENPADELRAEQAREVFVLLDAVIAAIANEALIPGLVAVDDVLDSGIAALWLGFMRDAADPESAAAVAQMIDTGTPVS